MPGLIRSVLAVVLLAVLWSFTWFQEDGVAFFVPGVGGVFVSFVGEADYD